VLINILLILGLAVITWPLFHLFKARPESGGGATEKRARAGSSRAATPYAAVSIKCSGMECQATSAIQGKRYIGTEAPTLPLSDCTSEKCTCRYFHHNDRRNEDLGRRILAYSMKEDIMFSGGDDRRLGMGRRASDWETAYQMNPSIG